MPLSSLLALYAAGLLSFASPCVLPMLPLYLSVLGGAHASANDAQASRRRLRLAGIGFAVGLSVVFVALGMGASALSGTLAAHRRALSIGAGALLVLFGLKLVGLLRLRLLEQESRPLLERVPSPGGLFGGLLFGAAFGLGWTPCVGPILGAALTYAASSATSPFAAGAQLAVYALGLSTPLVAAAFAAEAVLGLTRRMRAATPVLQRATGAILVIVGGLLATDRLGGIVPSAGVEATAAPCAVGDAQACAAPALDGVDGSAAAVPKGRPHLIEFVSGHCTVCERMAPVVAELERACAMRDATIIRVNVDAADGKALAAHYGVRMVPSFVSVDAEGVEVERIVGEQPRERLALALADVRGEACL